VAAIASDRRQLESPTSAVASGLPLIKTINMATSISLLYV
jgi:hypothetical protein